MIKNSLPLALLLVLVSGCGEESSEMVKIWVNLPSKKLHSPLDLLLAEGPEAYGSCQLPTFRVKVNGPGINPPIISEDISALTDATNTDVTVSGTVSLNVPKGLGRYIDVKGLGYESTCTTPSTTSSYQTWIYYGRRGPLAIDSSQPYDVPVTISTQMTQLQNGTALTYNNFSTLYYPTTLATPCGASYTLELRDLDLPSTLPIVYNSAGLNSSFYVGPVFPHSRYDVQLVCQTGPTTASLGYADTLSANTTANITDY